MFRQWFQRPAVPDVTPQEAFQRQRTGAVILDVREPEEWHSGHIPGAQHIPLGQLPQRIHELNPHHECIVVCRSGNRSATAAAMLLQAGFTVSNLAGGMLAWQRQRLPVVREP